MERYFSRREFLKFSLIFPFSLLYKIKKDKIKYFDFAEISGSHKEIGYKIGKYFKKNIDFVLNQRKEWVVKLKDIISSNEGKYFKEVFIKEINNSFPFYIQEIEGLANGSGYDLDTIWAINLQCELEYIKEKDGCSSIYFKDKNENYFLHNEDGHKANYGKMFIVLIKPPSKVNFISIVYPGLLPGNAPGINKEGIFQTTNYIGSIKVFEGVPRYVLSRAILEAKNLKEAKNIALYIPKAYPCHHNIGSFEDDKYISIEATPLSFDIIEPEGLYFHTNHLIFDKTKDYPFEEKIYREKSSVSRYEVIKKEVENLKEPKFADLFNILSSHKRKPYSPCRHPEGDVEGQTLCTAHYDLKKKEVNFYEGNPCISFMNYGKTKINLKDFS